MVNNGKKNALVLFSGGLDSMLAAKVLMEQGIEVTGINFESNFFSADKARAAADQLGIKLVVKNISNEIWALVKNPPSGLGKNMNPCVDCHALMIKTAGELTSPQPSPCKGEGDIRYDLLATGEVLGERPFSQNRLSLDRVVKLAGFEVLRPLSAKLLPETEAEKLKLVDRDKLLNISGRSRKRQFELARKYSIKEYPTPDGGCLLTDPAFSKRLKEMLTNWPDSRGGDIELLKYGRIFWLNLNDNGMTKKALAVIGRHEQDNNALAKLAKKGDFVLKLKDITGPLTVVRIFNFPRPRDKQFSIFNNVKKVKIPNIIGRNPKCIFTEENDLLNYISILTGYYSTKARGKEVEVEIKIINSSPCAEASEDK